MGAKPPSAGANLEKEVGKYKFEAAGFDVEVKLQDGKLVAIVPGQPTYTLENVKERRYKLTGVDGFYITFSDKDAYLEQPQGNYNLPKIGTDTNKKEVKDAWKKWLNPAMELVGKYQTPGAKMTIEVRDDGDKVTLNVAGQQPYELKERSKDVFSTLPLPDTYSLKVKRAADGKLEGLIMVQPEGEFPLNYAGAADQGPEKPKITAEEVITKTIDALGGAEALKSATSRQVKFEIDFENQGVKGFGTSYAKVPNMTGTHTTLTAVGKEIATIDEYFDGHRGRRVLQLCPLRHLHRPAPRRRQAPERFLRVSQLEDRPEIC